MYSINNSEKLIQIEIIAKKHVFLKKMSKLRN